MKIAGNTLDTDLNQSQSSLEPWVSLHIQLIILTSDKLTILKFLTLLSKQHGYRSVLHARLRLHQLFILWRSKNSITLNSIQNEIISMSLGFIIYRIMSQMCPSPLMGYNRLNNKEKLYCSQMEDYRFYSRRIAFESCLLVTTVRNRDCVLATLTTQFSHSFLLRQQKEQVIQL